MRELVNLECTTCRRRNYITTKNKKTHSKRIEQKKYCPFCNKRTIHRETR